MPCYRKGTWTEEEDNLLLSIVNVCGPWDWLRVSDMIGTRTAKQCAGRYHQYLRPGLDHGPLTTYECLLVDKIVLEKGKCWAYIAKLLGNRSENKIKNWWYSRRYKQYRERRQDRLSVGFSSSTLEFAVPPRPVNVPDGQGWVVGDLDTRVLERRIVQRYDPQPGSGEVSVLQFAHGGSQSRPISFRSIYLTTNFQDVGNASKMSRFQGHTYALPTSACSQHGSYTQAPNHHTAQYTLSGDRFG